MHRLAVDLGTCNTVAVVSRPGVAPRALLFDGSPVLPSAVFVDGYGSVHAGRDAERLMADDPARFEPFPKRRIDDGSVWLGDRAVPVVDLLAGVLRRVAAEAALVSAPDTVVLTAPVRWGTARRGVLRQAAAIAGFNAVTIVDEPVAAGWYCASVLGQRLDPGRLLVVFDFGGGTLDVSVVRTDPSGLTVLGAGGLDDLGGADIDAALAEHVAPGGGGGDRRTLWTEVRAAKEMLSRTTVAPVRLPGGRSTHLTRDELHHVAAPLVERAVDETARVLGGIGVRPDQILLVGGTSRLPLVASRLHARFGVVPVVPEQPELPVAYGAVIGPPQAIQPAPVPQYPVPRQPAPYQPVPYQPVPQHPASVVIGPGVRIEGAVHIRGAGAPPMPDDDDDDDEPVEPVRRNRSVRPFGWLGRTVRQLVLIALPITIILIVNEPARNFVRDLFR